MKKIKKIAIIYKGMSPEKDISEKTAQAVVKALKKLKYPYVLIEANNKLQSSLMAEKPDLAFLAVHGIYGEDGCTQAICEMLKIPYTGSGVLASALCMDKLFLKKILLKEKISTPKFYELDSKGQPPKISKYPVVVKASHGGSSLGVYIVKNKKLLKSAIEKAKKIGSSVFIEDYLPSVKEVNVSYLDGKILTPIEIVPKGGFYDYKRKYQKGQSQYYTPARLDSLTLQKIKRLAKKAFAVAQVRSYARADFLVKNGKTPYLIEINTLPGLTESSLLPKSAHHDGISFVKVVESIIKNASTDYKTK